jgi:hypothetical protein
VRRWRAAMVHGEAKCPTDLKRDARVAWRKFVSCVEALPADQASPLWQLAHDQASARLAAGSCHSGGQSM